MNNRSAFRRLLANRKYRQSILRNLLRGIFSNRLIEALIPKWNRFDGLLSITKRGAATIRKRAIEMNPFAELTTGHGSVRIVPQRLRFENLEERRVLAFSSIIVDGTAGNDSLVIIATGIDSGSYSLNGGVAVPFASLSGLTFNAGTGTDVLRIINPSGEIFAPSGGIDYHGGGNTGDALELIGGGGSLFNETYFVGSTTPFVGAGPTDNGSGLLRFTGPQSLDLRFTGLAPIVDTVAVASLTVNSTDAANAISLTNGAVAPRLKVAVDAFESIEFDNKDTLTINAGDGIVGGDAADTIDVDFSNIPAGLTAINVNTDEGSDIVNVQAKAGPTFSIFGNDGTNTFNVGKAGTLDAVVGGQLIFFGNPATFADVINFNDAANLTANAYVVTNNFFSRTGTATAGWTENIGQVTLNAGLGSDTINAVAGFLNTLTTINAGGGDDVVTVGFNGTLNFVVGSIVIAGQAGTNDKVVIDDSANNAASTINVTSTLVTRVGQGTISYGTVEGLSVLSGTLADVINLNSTSIPTSVSTGSGDDSIMFANGVSLNGGTVDGGANTDTIDYSAYTTNVSVNLGGNAPGGALAGVIDGGQENPGQITTATGTVSITNYNSATKTFDISAHVSNFLPAAVTGFHIHRAQIGVNGGIIIDLAALFGLPSLVADGLGGFDFNAAGVILPAQHEAAFLGGITYFNVHTAAAPGGLVRGQILPSAVFVAAPGTATGTGGISNIENATGGTGADSLVGDLAANVLSGNDGNDTIVGAPGNDTMNGGNNNDVLVWSNGDNNDIIDGALGTDVVQVNGSIAGGDNFTVGANGTRIAFARTNLVPFTLDIGTAETLIVNGGGGDDTETVNSLVGVSDLTAVNLFGLNGNDTFNTGFTLAPISVNVNGGSHTGGDTLNVDAAGGPVTDSGVQLTKPGFNPINYTQIESLSVTNVGDVTITGTGADDTLVVNATSANAGNYRLNAGPVITFTGMTKLTFNSGAGSDALTINNPAGGLFAPIGGIDYNGGGQAGDMLSLMGGGSAAFNETYFVGTTTPPVGAGGNNGDGLVRFTGPTPVDIRFTGLAPIIDTVAVASLTVNATDAVNTINITNAGVAPRVLVAVDAFEPIEFDNKTVVVVNAGDGLAGGDSADNILVSFNFAPSGLTNITINADEGVDSISVTGNSAASTLTINGGDGLDIVNIGNTGTVGAPGLLTPIAGAVTVDGGTGGANLVVDGSGAGVAADYAVSSTTVTRSLPAGFGGVTYSNLSTLLLTVGAGANVVSVTSTAAGVPTTVNTNAGSDTVNVTATNATGPLTINTGTELDIVNIGNTGAVGAPGLLTPIAGAVTVDGGTGGANLVVDGSGAGVAADYAITSTTVTRSLPAGFGGVTYSNLSTLLLTVGSGANVVNVTSTAAGVPTTVNTNAGTDTVNVTSTNATGPLTINTGSELDIVNIGNTGAVGAPGLLTPIAGAVTVDGGTGGANLVVDGSGAGVSADYAISSTTVTRSLPAGFGGVTYSNLSTLLLTVGSGANVVSVNGTAAGVVTNIATGAGDDSINLADAVSLNGGTIDGGANTDTINYSAYTSSVSVNLGSNAPGGALSATVEGGQENPGQVTAAVGTASITNYNSVTKTFDISAHISNLAPGLVTGYHIHRAPVGTNGSIIVDLAAIFGLGSLIPDGAGGFDFNKIGVALPAQHEAAFLGGITYFNVHTAAAPGGLIRGQLFPTGVFLAAAGTATNTGGISNIENATGGTGADSLVGDLGINVLSGGLGNDTIVGAPGNDTLDGGDNNDVLVWSNGDNNDKIDGGLGADIVQVNGSVAGDDVFTTSSNAARLTFARSSLVPFTLDIGTTETLISNGIGGNDTMTVNNLVGVADLTVVNSNGFAGNDTFNITASPNVTNNVNGLTQVVEDVLVYSGPSPATKTITGQNSGSITAGSVLPVNFISIENLSTSPPGNLFNDVINLGSAPLAAAGGQDGNPNQVLVRRDATNTFLQIFVDFNTNDNGGVPNPVLFSSQLFTSVGTITVDGGSDNDTLVIDQSNGFINRAITFNGGGQTSAPLGDVLRLTGGSFTSVTYNHTNASSGNVNVDGTTYTYTGLEPIFDNMNAVNRVFNFNNLAQTITIEDDLLGGNVAGMSQAASPGQAEIVFFSNPTGSLTVNGGTGGNIVRVFPTIDAAYATPTTTINAGSGVDEVRVLRSATGTVVNINTQAGLLDRTVVGADAFPGTNSGTGAGTLNNILGVVNVADSGGSGELFVDASADAAGTYNFTATQITRGAVTVNYNVSIDPLHLATGNSADVVNVTGTTATTNTIFTNGGDDEIRVTAVAAVGNLHIETGAGVFDRTVIGATSFAAFNTGTGSLSNVQGTVNVNHNSNSLGETYIDNSGDATNGRVFNFNDVPGIPFFATQGIALTSNFMAGAINVANNASDFYQFADGSGASTLNINATADSGNADSSFFGNVGSDLFVINGDGLGDDNLFLGGDGTDQFFLNVAGNIGNLSTSGINSVRIDGNAASDSVNRDRLVVNDNSGTARSLDYLTMNTQGDFNIAPNGAGNGLFGGNLPAGVVQVRSMETYVFNSTGVANDTVRVFGATDNGVIGGLNPANDDLTVALLPTTAPVAGPNSPLPNGTSAANSAIVYRNGAPYIGTPPVALVNPANLPGVSGGGLGTDFLLNGIAISGLTLDGNGNAGIAGDGDRAIVYAASEDPLVQAGNATNIFGLGAGVLQPGFGVGKAYDTIKTTDGSVITNSFAGPLASVLLNTGSFVQSGPANSTQQAALIVNGGDELGVQANNIADSITATLSTNFNIQINGNLPGLTFVNPADKLSPRQGDQLILNLPANAGSLNVFSDNVAPVPNVSVGASNLTFAVRNSSIEILVLDAGPIGTVNIIGDNNDAAVTQNDYFRVRGRDVDGNSEGVNELQLELGGNWNPASGAVNLSSPIFINNVTRLNVSGGNAIGFDAFGNAIPQTVGTGTDALDITAYADNTPRGWGVETYFNEGDDAVSGDGGLAAPDLLIFNGVLGVSEKIVVQPSSLLNGQIFSNNAATNTPIAVVNYMLNSHIVVNGSSPAGTFGDTDSLTLRGTNSANPGSSGNEDVVADFTATGTAVTPQVRVYDAGPAAGVGIAGRPTALELADTAGTQPNVLYNLQNFSNFNTIGFELLLGSDVISLIGRNDGGLTVDVDGGSDSFADGISIPGVVGAADQFIYVAGNSKNAASVFSQRAGALGITRMNLTGVDNVSFDGGGGAGADILRAFGSPGVDSFTASPASAIAGRIAIGSYPAITYANLGTAISRIILVNDAVGSGTNLDSALIEETAASDANVWTPASNTSGILDLTTGGVSSQITLTGFNSTIVDAKAGVDSITTTVSNAIIDQGTTSGSGTITATTAGGQGLLPLGFRNVESATVTGGTVVVNGTDGNDTINVSLTGVVTVSNAGGVVLQTYNLAGANALVINSIGGDDSITIASSALFSGGIQVISGDNGNGSDSLSVGGADLVVDLEANKISGVVGGPVSFNGIEHLNVTATATITINGKSSTDLLTVTPTGANTTSIVPSVGGLLSIETNNPGTLTIAGAGGVDSVVVNGTSAADTINVVKGAIATVAVGALKVVSIDSSTTENLSVNAGDGVDTINLSGTTNSSQVVNILGGSPTSNAGAASDTLNITMATIGTTAATPGATPDAGVITSPDGNTIYSGIEFFNLIGAAGANTLNAQGSHNRDTMALQFLGGANRIWINDRAVYSFSNYATVNMNGLFGDDKINVLPIGLVGVTTITVAGGDPTTSDELVVSGSSGNDVINYSVSNTVGSGSVAITGAPVVNFTTTEFLVIDGQGGTDALTVTSPSAHRTTITPGSAADSGLVGSQALGAGPASVPLTYAHIGASGSVTIAGAGDIVEFNGTPNSDKFNVTGTTAQIINTTGGFATPLINLTGVFALELRGLDGDDTFNVAANLAAYSGGVVVDGGNPSASDALNLSGPTGAVTVNFATNTITGYGATVTTIGIEILNANANNNNANVVGTAGDDSFDITPTGADAVTFKLASSNPSIGSTPVVNLSAVGATLTADGGLGTNSLTFNGTASSDFFQLSRSVGALTLARTGTQVVTATNTFFSWNVKGGDGSDFLDVSEPAGGVNVIELNIDGGTGSNTLNFATNFVTNYVPAGGNNGSFLGGAPINFTGVSTATVTLNAPSTSASIAAGGGNNHVTLTGTAVSTIVATVDNGTQVTFNGTLNTLTINAGAGDDTIAVTPGTYTGVININGGDPTASDTLIVNGTAANNTIIYSVSDTIGSGLVAITGSATINFTTTEFLVIDGQGGTDALTVTSPSAHRTTITPGSAADSGAIRSQALGAGTASVPLTYAHIGALGTLTIAGAGDVVEFNGTPNRDKFNVTGTTTQIINAAGGFVTNLVTLTNVFALEVRGLDGDDTFNVTGSLAAITGGIMVDGGNPSASDVVNLTGAAGAVAINFANNTVTGYGGVISLIGVELLNADANGNNLDVNATNGDDNLTVTPTTDGGVTSRLTSAPTLSTPVVNTSNIGNFTVNLLAGSDNLAVVYTQFAETITVTGTSISRASLEAVNYTGAANLMVYGQAGSDTFNVTPSAATSIFIDGGDPIGIIQGDKLVVNNAVGFFPGPENDEGGVKTDGGDVSFDHIESLTIAGIAGCPFLIMGTNGDDDITVIARDASTTAGADGVQDFTFSINNGINVVMLNQADLFIDALSGDDDIVIRTAAPNEAAWDVNVRVAGGSPSIGAPLEADRLVLETPNKLNGFDNIVFNPSGNDTGNLVVDKDNNGVYDAAGTDSLITFGSFVFDCPPSQFNYISSAGGVDLIQVNGEGAPAIDDNLTINGTALNDTTVINPTGIGTGTFASGASPQFIFQSFDNVTVNPGTGGFDRVEINGTAGPDTVTSNANTITLGGAVTLGAGIDQVDINTFDGNDSVTLTLAVAGLKKVVNLGAGNDVANLLGVAVDPADSVIYGGDGDDNIIGSPNPDLIYGGSGNDVLIGAGGVDQIYGEAGNDIFGNPSATPNGVADDAGNDLFNGGEGSDTFIWEPGDGSDTIEGGAGDADVLSFFGGAGTEVFNVFAKLSDPSRAILFRSTGAITIDMAGIDQINVTGNAGADAYVVGRANNGDSGNSVAPTSPYVDPTASLSDLSSTEVRVVNITEAADAPDNVFIDGRPTDDNLTVTVESTITKTLRVAGLPYAVRILGADTADRLTIRGNEGNDSIKAINSIGAVEAIIGITFAGGAGNDSLSADAILIGGIGNDFLEGGLGADLLFGNEGDDTMIGGAGLDTFDGGSGFDTILVRGTPGNDVIDISQTASTTLVETVNGVAETDTLALVAGTRTVERVSVVADAGNDTIRVQWADSLGTDANVNSLRVDVDGGAGSTGDRLGVVDLGTGDLILYERGTTNDSGAMAIGPGNAEPLIVNFSDVEIAQPIAGAGGDVVVFKHDPFEFNDARTLATYLGANAAINVDPTINPGLDPAFGFPADEDWYRVVAEKTGVLDFQVYFRQVATVPSGRPGLPNAGNLDIAVTDTAGNVVAGFGVNDNSNDERIRIPAIAGQTYYLRVFANGNAINTYNITVANYIPPTPRDMELLDNPVGDPPPANSDTGRSQFDNITRDNTPTLVFRLDDAIFLNDLPGNNVPGAPPDEVIPIQFRATAGTAGYRLAVFDEGSSPLPGTQVGTAPQTPLGFATLVGDTNNNGIQDPGETVQFGVYQFTTPVLTDGSHFLTARVQMVDPATPQQTGFGDRSVALEIVVDTVIPPAFFGQISLADSTQGLNAASDSGVVSNPATFADRVTSNTRPSFYGRAEADTIVRLYVESNGIAGLQSTGATPDLFLGLTTATPLDGTNQFPGGQWSYTTPLDLNNPALGFTKDGLRVIYSTGEDVAGNTTTDATADVLNLFLDTSGPQVTGLQITGFPTYNLFGLKPGNAIQGPTPKINSLTINVRDLPNRSNADANFLYSALDPTVAVSPGNFVLKGDHNGIISIKSITFVGNPASNGNPATGSLALSFFAPLPDDRFTLTVKDTIVDRVGNKLDGESNAAEPNATPTFPTGDGQPGGDFVARFTVDSRPEVGVVSEGIVYVDINGNFVWDPEGKDRDATNRDLVFQFGQLVDAHFAGNFAPARAATASGYDKLGAYGKFAGTYSFVLDTNDDGVADFSSLMPAEYQVNGIPVAGNFNAAHPGDEIGLFDGSFWYLDTNGNNQIDLGERIASNFNGLPIVGDFTGDGKDDLAAFNNASNTFAFDTNRDGIADFTWRVADDIGRFIGLSGFTDRPVAGDLNLDGIDDIGLWVKDRQGTLPRNSGEYFFWVSDRANPDPAVVFDSFSPDPLGNDLFAEFGDDFGLPIFGNFDPPVGKADDSNLLHNYSSPLDVDRDGFISPLDALIVVNVLNNYPKFPSNDPVRTYYTIGQQKADPDNDRTVSPLDALTIINYLNRNNGSGEGEADSSIIGVASDQNRATDDFFAQLGADLENDGFKRKRR